MIPSFIRDELAADGKGKVWLVQFAASLHVLTPAMPNYQVRTSPIFSSKIRFRYTPTASDVLRVPRAEVEYCLW